MANSDVSPSRVQRKVRLRGVSPIIWRRVRMAGRYPCHCLMAPHVWTLSISPVQQRRASRIGDDCIILLFLSFDLKPNLDVIANPSQGVRHTEITALDLRLGRKAHGQDLVVPR